MTTATISKLQSRMQNPALIVPDALQAMLTLADIIKKGPLPSATLSATLQSFGKPGKSTEIWRGVLTSDEHGEAEWQFPQPDGKARLELTVVAETGGRRATRYFQLR